MTSMAPENPISTALLNDFPRASSSLIRSKIRIEASSGLTESEINRMRKEAEANAEQDKKEKERIEKLNAADSLIFQTEKQIKEFGDKLSESSKKLLEDSLADLKKASETKDLAVIEKATEALSKIWQQVSNEMYSTTNGADAQSKESNKNEGNDSGDNVTEAEFEEVK